MIKLFALILADFQRNCDEAMDYLKRTISQYPNGIYFRANKVNDLISRIDQDWIGNIFIDDVEVEIRFGQIHTSGREIPTWDTQRGIYSLGNGGSWLSKIINDIKIQALELVFAYPKKANVEDFFKWITTNWYFMN